MTIVAGTRDRGGTVWKVTITLALVVPMLVMMFELRLASHRPEFAFLAVPIGGLGIFAVQFLPHLWEPGRVREPLASRRRENDAA